MLIIGCDFHTRYQQIAMLDEATGELVERRLEHENSEAHSSIAVCRSRFESGWRPLASCLCCRVDPMPQSGNQSSRCKGLWPLHRASS
jgi:hypothetical protein